MTATLTPPQLLFPGQAAAPDGPVDLAAMYVMHRAFRRDLDAFATVAPRIPSGDGRRWTEVAERFAFFSTVLHKHHHGEDVGLWPLLAERGATPEVLVALEQDHVEVDGALAEVGAHLRELAAGRGDVRVRAALVDALASLDRVLRDHLEREERDGMALVQRHLDPDDWTRLDEEVFSKDYAPREVPAVLGWVVSGLPADALRRMPGGESALFRAFGRAAAWRFDRRDARVLGGRAKVRHDRALVRVSRWVGAAHTRVLRATGWRVGARWMGGDVVLLTHTGRRSQRTHTTPLLHVRDGDDLVVAASNGGIDREPQWWLNLQVDPHGEVEVGGRRTPVVARRVEGAGQGAAVGRPDGELPELRRLPGLGRADDRGGAAHPRSALALSRPAIGWRVAAER